MHFSELKNFHVSKLVEMAVGLEIDNANRMRKHELIFSPSSSQASAASRFRRRHRRGAADGFGFLRSPDTSHLAGTDDIYISPSQIRRFNLHTGDTIEGEIRTPMDGGKRFISRWSRWTGSTARRRRTPRTRSCSRNLTALFADRQMRLERDVKGSEENITSRIIDIVAPIGWRPARPAGGEPEVGQDGDAAAHPHAITSNHPRDPSLLLIDERPEK